MTTPKKILKKNGTINESHNFAQIFENLSHENSKKCDIITVVFWVECDKKISHFICGFANSEDV